jgi:predicted ATPase
MATTPEKEIEETIEDRAKPPFLRRVRLRGYKSIAFCDVSLEPLTILVGRNASGKSNFLDALAFLRDLMDMRVAEAVDQRKGWRSLRCRSDSVRGIEMGFESTFESFGSTYQANYTFLLEPTKQNQIRVHKEDLTLTQGGQVSGGFGIVDGRLHWFLGPTHGLNELSVPDSDRGTDEGMGAWARKFGRTDRLLLGVLGAQPFLDLSESLRASDIYNFYPTAIRELQPSTGSPMLVRDGANLGRAIEGLDEIEPETIIRLGQYLQAIVPGVITFHTQPYGDFETVRFSVEGRPGQPPIEFDASSMSDGTLRVLASLVAAFQIVLPSGFPGFVGIEEPETALHPAAIRALVSALDEATLRTQILLTTHNTEMLDDATIRPKNIRVVQMIDGQTVIGPVDEASVEIIKRKLDTLGGLERQNQLEPDFDDLERQRRLSPNGKGTEK